MKIMHFVSGLKYGGVEKMLLNYTYMINKNNDVDEYIVYQHRPNNMCLNQLEMSGNKCIRISSKKSNIFKNFIDTFSVIKRINPDIIHAHMNLMNFIPLFLGFILGIKIRISHSHIAHNNINSNLLSKIFKWSNLIFSNCLMACGEKAGKYMYGKKKFTIIRNCVDINGFLFKQNKRRIIRKQLDIKEDEILIGNVGRLTNQKNQFFLIDLLKDLKNVKNNYKLVILGQGELKKRLISYIYKNNLNKNVIIHDPVQNIADFYCAMDIFLLPSFYEGFPVSSVEAQVNGLTVIMSNNVDISSKLLKHTFFISLNNKDMWVNTILKQSLNYHFDNLNPIMFKDYDIKYNYIKLIDLYRRLFNEKNNFKY